MEQDIPDHRFITLVSDSPIPSVISDPRLPDNPIVACNSAFCELTGYGPDEVIGRNCRFLSGPGTEPWLSEEIRRGVREHRPVLVEILNYKRNGQPFRNAVLVAPIYDEHDDLLYFLGSQIEIEADASTPSSMRRIRAAEMVKALSPRQGQVLKFVARGLLTTLVASNCPPMPTSSTAKSTFCWAKWSIPTAVMISKKVGGISPCFSTSSQTWAI